MQEFLFLVDDSSTPTCDLSDGESTMSVRRLTHNWPPRFLAKVDTSAGVDGCWVWLAASRNDYGILSVEGKAASAHRRAYELTTGTKLGALLCDHRCHNTLCVNPTHLRATTPKENSENVGLSRNNKSGYRGVYWNKRNRRWQAYVSHNGKDIYVGLFDSKDEAGEAARRKRRPR